MRWGDDREAPHGASRPLSSGRGFSQGSVTTSLSPFMAPSPLPHLVAHVAQIMGRVLELRDHRGGGGGGRGAGQGGAGGSGERRGVSAAGLLGAQRAFECALGGGEGGRDETLSNVHPPIAT